MYCAFKVLRWLVIVVATFHKEIHCCSTRRRFPHEIVDVDQFRLRIVHPIVALRETFAKFNIFTQITVRTLPFTVVKNNTIEACIVYAINLF